MSQTVDTRVVQMQFDNSKFESNVKTSMGTIEKLKKSLNFEGSAKGLDSLEKASKSFTLNDIGNSLDAISGKFTAMSIVGITALQNITNSAIDAGKRMTAALTIDPMKSGFSEYELKMGSIQTIMASTGEKLSDVNNYLDDLNTYSDRTIYSFSDMTQNIGKFTNAGVKLKDAVAAIKGVSNEAAISGANTNEASRAMYNFAQALSSGYTKLIDWKSIENANMATVDFKNQLIQTAVAEGTLSKAADGTYKTLKGNSLTATQNFNDTLTDQWLTSKVLITTLSKYADETTDLGKKAYAAAQDVKTFSQLIDTLKEALGSGWAETWQNVIGDFDQAKQMFTSWSTVLGNMIKASSDARNKILKGWADLGGRNDIIQTFINVFNAISTVIGPVKEAWNEIFPPATGERIKSITDAIQKFTHSLILNKDSQNLIKTAFTGLFSVVNVGVNIFKGLTSILFSLLKALSPVGKAVLTLAAYVGVLLNRFSAWVQESGIIQKSVQFVTDAIDYMSKKVEAFALALADNQYFQIFVGLIVIAINKIKDAFKSLKVPDFSSFLTSVKAFTSTVSKSNIVTKAIDAITKSLGNLVNVGKNALNIKVGFVNPLTLLSNKAGEFTYSFGKIKDAFGGIPTVVEGFGNTVKRQFNGIIRFFSGINWAGILQITLIASIVRQIVALGNVLFGVAKVVSGFAEIEKQASKAIAAYSAKLKAEAFQTMAKGIRDVAVSVAILAASMVLLSLIPSDKILQGAVAVGALMAALVAVSYVINKFKEKADVVSTLQDQIVGIVKSLASSGKILASSIALNLFVVSLIGLAAVLKIYSKLNIQNMGQTMANLSVALVALVGSLVLIGKAVKGSAGGLISAGVFLLALVVALTSLLGVIKLYSKFDWSSAASGIGEVVAMMLVLTSVAGLLALAAKNSSIGLLGVSFSILSLVTALQKLLPVIQTFSDMNKTNGIESTWWSIAELLAVIAGMSMAVAGLGAKCQKSAAGLLAASLTMLVFVAAIKKLQESVTYFSEMDLSAIVKGLGAVIILITAITVAVSKSGKNSSFQGAASLLALCATIITVTGALALLSTIPIDKLGTAAIALGAMIIVTGLLAKAAQKAKDSTGALIAITALIAVMSLSFATLSAIDTKKLLGVAGSMSILMLAITAVLALSKANEGSWKSLVGVSVAIGAIAGSLYLLSNAPIEGLKAAANAMAEVMAVLTLVIASTALAKGQLPALIGVAAALAALGVSLALISKSPVEGIVAAGNAMAEVELVLIAVIAVSSLAQGALASLVGITLVVAGIGGVLFLLAKFSDADKVKTIADSLSEVMLSLSAALVLITIAGAAAEAALVGMALIVTLLAGSAGLLWLFSNLSENSGFIDKGSEVLNKIATAIGSFFGSIVSGFSTAISASLPQIGTDLSTFMTNLGPFISGANSVDPASMSGIKSLAEAILVITASNVLDGIFSFVTGGNSIQKFADQLPAFGEGLKKYSDATAGINLENVTAAGEAAKSVIAFAKDLPNQGGWLAGIVGDNNLGLFKDQLPDFATGLKAFSDNSAGIVLDNVKNAKEAALLIIDFADKLPNQDGWTAGVFGDNNMGLFKDQLPDFATGLKSFSDNSAGINLTNFDNAKSAALSIIEFAKLLPNQGGVAGFFAGENSLSLFKDQLPDFALALVSFSNNAAGIQPENVAKAYEAAKSIVDVVNAIPNSVTGAGVLSDFSYQMSVFIANVVDYSKTAGKIDETGISKAESSVSSLTAMLINIGTVDPNAATNFSNAIGELANTGISNFVDKFANCDSDIDQTITQFVNRVTASIASKESQFRTSGNNLILGFVKGMEEEYPTANLSVIGFGSNLVGHLNKSLNEHSPSKETEQSGYNFVQGFINGIKSNGGTVNGAVSDLASNVLSSFNGVLGIHSPSKEMESSGSDVDEGAAVGIKENAGSPLDAIADVGKSLLDKGKSVFSNVKDNLANSNPLSGFVASAKETAKDYSNSFADWGGDIKSAASNLLGNQSSDASKSLGITDNLAKETEKAQKSSLASTKSTQAESLTAEDMYWAALLAKKKQGADAVKYQDMSVKDFEQDILSKTKEIYSKYTSEYSNEKSSLMSSVGLFTKMDKKDTVSSKDLIKNLKDQVGQFAIYKNVLTSLNSRVTDTGLRDTINKMGIDNLEELKAMNKMTDSQLTEYTSLYESKYQSCNDIADVKMTDLKETTKTQLSDLLGVTVTDLDGFGSMFNEKLSGLNQYVATAINSMNSGTSGATDVGKNIVSGIAEGMADTKGATDAGTKLGTDTLQASKDALGIASPSKEYEAVGQFCMEGMILGFSDRSTAVTDACVSVMNQAKNAATSDAASFKDPGQLAMANLSQGIAANVGSVKTSSTNVIAASLSAITGKFGEFKTNGSNLISNLASGISTKASDAGQAITSLMDTLKSSITTKYESFKSAGMNVVSGFIEGVKSNVNGIIQAGSNLGSMAINAAMKALGEHSPSKVFNQIGRYADEGFANGLSDYADVAAKESSLLGQGAIDSMQYAMDKVNTIANSGSTSFTPTIRPVLDLTQIQNGSSMMGGMLDTNVLSRMVQNANYGLDSYNSQVLTVDDSNTVNAITKLHDDITSLGEKVGKLQVVLDSGTLVGAISTPLDSALGTKVIRTWREKGGQ